MTDKDAAGLDSLVGMEYHWRRMDSSARFFAPRTRSGSAAADPAAAVRLVAEGFLSTSPDDYRPEGYDGEMVYGGGREIVYCVASLWSNLLACARTLGDGALEDRLVAAFGPFARGKRAVFAHVPHVDFSVVGAVPLEIAVLRGDRRAREMGLALADAQWAEPRAGDPEPPRNPQPLEVRLRWWRLGYSPETRLWIDDTYMISALQTAAFRATGDVRYVDRAARELLLYAERLRRPDGLFAHDDGHRLAWGRGNGWMAAALPLVLRCLAPDDPRREPLGDVFRGFADALLPLQRPDGLWGQLLDDPSSWTESSGSAMAAHAFAEGIRLGWLDGPRFGPAVDRAWRALASRLDARGNLAGTCQGTGPSSDPALYLSRPCPNGDPHGQAAFVWLCRSLLEGPASPAPDAPPR